MISEMLLGRWGYRKRDCSTREMMVSLIVNLTSANTYPTVLYDKQLPNAFCPRRLGANTLYDLSSGINLVSVERSLMVDSSSGIEDEYH